MSLRNGVRVPTSTNEVSTESGSDRVGISGNLDLLQYCDPVATAPGTDTVNQPKLVL